MNNPLAINFSELETLADRLNDANMVEESWEVRGMCDHIEDPDYNGRSDAGDYGRNWQRGASAVEKMDREELLARIEELRSMI